MSKLPGSAVWLAVLGTLGMIILGIVISPPLFPTPSAAVDTLDPACKQWTETHQPTPGSEFGLALSTSTIDVTMKVGEKKEVMTITSAPSTGFNFCGYQYPPGGQDLIWSPWSGGLHEGGSTTVTITAIGKPGIYEGLVTLFDLDTGNSIDIPVKVVVTN